MLLDGLAAQRLRVEIAPDATAGLQAWERLQPALVILFPDADPAGWTLCRAIRCVSPLPILVVSASRSLDDLEDAIAWGADDYLVLPLDPKAFAARARAAIARATQAAGGSPAPGGF